MPEKILLNNKLYDNKLKLCAGEHEQAMNYLQNLKEQSSNS